VVAKILIGSGIFGLLFVGGTSGSGSLDRWTKDEIGFVWSSEASLGRTGSENWGASAQWQSVGFGIERRSILESESPGPPVIYAKGIDVGGGIQKGFRRVPGYEASPTEVETGEQVEAANAGVILYWHRGRCSLWGRI